MRRLAAAVALAFALVAAPAAEAGWGHWRHRGYGGWGGYGYRGIGWGGYGHHGFGLSIGYGGPWYGGYSYYQPTYCLPAYGYGACDYGYGGFGGYGGYGAPIGLGYSAYSPYGIYYNPSASYLSYHLPPLHEPAELNFGPQAVKQFLGLPRDFALGGLRTPAPLAADAVLAAKPAMKIAERGLRISNAEARRRAERHLADGDEQFRVQNYHGALQRYKLAANAAPDVAEPYWRQGHALVATHNYELAPGAFKRALALTDDVSRGGFRLDDLYADAAMSKARHLESLAGWALERDGSADPYFLLGLFLTYDGQAERGEKFFQRAADLAGFGGGHIAVFLAPANEAPRNLPPRAVDIAPAPIAPRALPVSAGTEI
jgi:hypothetical protein